MKPTVRRIIFTGGTLNLLLAFFHIFLCYQIFHFMVRCPFIRSCRCSPSAEWSWFSSSHALRYFIPQTWWPQNRQTVLMLNILIYLTRMLGEFILSRSRTFWLSAYAHSSSFSTYISLSAQSKYSTEWTNHRVEDIECIGNISGKQNKFRNFYLRLHRHF